MATDKFDLCSQALVLVGGNPITSFAGTSAEAITASTLYEDTVCEVISVYRWRFATRQYQLTREAAAPDMRWDAAYLLPPGTQLINAVLVNDVSIDFDRYENKLLCDAGEGDVVVAEITYRADEAYWPGYFATTLRLKLASLFAVPIAEDATKAAAYQTQYVAQLKAARLADAQSRTARKLNGIGGLRRFHGGRP